MIRAEKVQNIKTEFDEFLQGHGNGHCHPNEYEKALGFKVNTSFDNLPDMIASLSFSGLSKELLGVYLSDETFEFETVERKYLEDELFDHIVIAIKDDLKVYLLNEALEKLTIFVNNEATLGYV